MQKAVTCNSGKNTLRGTLHMPECALNGTQKVPMVIIFHGFTAVRSENKFMFVDLSRSLEKAGIASVRFDFAGSGESDGCFRDVTVSSEIKDGEAILEYVKSMTEVDTDNVFILGMSMGGVVAGMLSGRHCEELKGCVLWSPAAVLQDDLKKGFIQDIKFDLSNVPEYVDVHSVAVGKCFVEDGLALDIYGETSNFTKAALILHGDKDDIAPPEYSYKYKEHLSNSQLIIVPGATHSYDTIELKETFINETVRFIKQHSSQ